MSLTLEPLTTDPWSAIVEAVADKIENTDLSFYKYLESIGTPLRTVYTQTDPGGDKNMWDPPLSKCPAVVLLSSAFPPVEDHGIGDERWWFSVTIYFKMRLPEKDASKGFQACHELLRTLFAGWRQSQLDPLQQITGVRDYAVEGNVTPDIATPESGKAVAQVVFDLKFRLAESILG
jgi:hypothetical protein